MKKIIFGTGNLAIKAIKHIDSVDYFLDNNTDKWGKMFFGKIIQNPSILKKENIGDIFIIVASQYYVEIKKQLESFGLQENTNFAHVKKYCILNDNITSNNKKDTLDSVSAHLLAKLLIDQNNQKKQPNYLYEMEFKVYSQWGEDGIIQYLINKIDIPNKTFVEFGVENYSEANTRFLLVNNNWDGMIIEMDTNLVRQIKNDEIYYKYNLKVVNSFITKDNINDLLEQKNIIGDIGLLSVDIDGNDYWVWDKIKVISPRIVICEYNNLLGLSDPLTIPYQEDFYRTDAHYSNLYYGANLLAMNQLAEKKGYKFVGTNLVGTNAFFVREDVIEDVKVEEIEKYNKYSKIRESRDKNGNLSYLSGDERIETIKGMPIFNLETNKLEKL